MNRSEYYQGLLPLLLLRLHRGRNRGETQCCTDKKIGGIVKAFSHGRSSLDSRSDIQKSSKTLTETNPPFVPKRFFIHLRGGIRRGIGEREADACTWERDKADGACQRAG